MNGADFKSAIATYFNRSDLTSMIVTCAALAVKKLERERFWFQLTSSTVSTTATTEYVAYPSDFLDLVEDGLKDTSGTALLKTDWATLDHWIRYSAGTGEPDWFALADKIYLYPIPDAIYALPIQYVKTLGFPGDALDNYWTDEVYDLTYWATIEELWKYLRNPNEETKARAQKLLILKDVRSMSGKLTGTGRVEYQDY